jgi:hypothetical protein
MKVAPLTPRRNLRSGSDMATVKGSRQFKMMVVAHRPMRDLAMRAGLAAVFVAGAAAASWYGFTAGIRENGEARIERDSLRDVVARLEGDNNELRQQLVNMEQSSDLDKQALDNVQQTIVGLRENIAQLEEDVLFYKQIMSPENSETGLVIGQLDLEATDVPATIRYKLELKQQGNNENLISGYANISILGMVNNAEMSYSLSDLSDAVDSTDIRLQFRYFQNIEGSLVLPEEFQPTKVQILAVAEGDNAKTVQKSFGWLVED